MLQSNQSSLKYATRFKKVYYPPNPDDMIKYEQNLPFEYTAAADGETVIILTQLIGALRILQIEKEIKPMAATDFSFNNNTGQISLLNGQEMAKDETLYGIYVKLITS